MTLKCLINPLATGAYFADVLSVAEAELRACFPQVQLELDARGSVTFLDVELGASHARALSRLSFVQAVFAPLGDALQLIDVEPGFALPTELVWGTKYRGKTSEVATQLAINVALASCAIQEPTTLFDPMAGRGTTLLWALRYGLEAWGVEKDGAAIDHLQRHVKRQTKLHRLKHSALQGGKRGKEGAFLEFRFPDAGEERRLRLITGDSRQSKELVQNKRFDLIVTDLPYGVQFVGPGGTRNPLPVIKACAPVWADRLQPGGAIVLVYNRLQPARESLVAAFAAAGLQIQDFEAPHRMSESILRDVLVLTKPV